MVVRVPGVEEAVVADAGAGRGRAHPKRHTPLAMLQRDDPLDGGELGVGPLTRTHALRLPRVEPDQPAAFGPGVACRLRVALHVERAVLLDGAVAADVAS